jgi:hypothetical protein
MMTGRIFNRLSSVSRAVTGKIAPPHRRHSSLASILDHEDLESSQSNGAPERDAISQENAPASYFQGQKHKMFEGDAQSFSGFVRTQINSIYLPLR